MLSAFYRHVFPAMLENKPVRTQISWEQPQNESYRISSATRIKEKYPLYLKKIRAFLSKLFVKIGSDVKSLRVSSLAGCSRSGTFIKGQTVGIRIEI